MRIQTNIVLLTPEGEVYKRRTKGEEEKEDLLLKHVIVDVLSTAPSKDPFKSFSLTKKFIESDEVELKAEDIAFIKETITAKGATTYVPFIIGQVISLIDA